jgi:hypothetical protein
MPEFGGVVPSEQVYVTFTAGPPTKYTFPVEAGLSDGPAIVGAMRSIMNAPPGIVTQFPATSQACAGVIVAAGFEVPVPTLVDALTISLLWLPWMLLGSSGRNPEPDTPAV